MSRGDCSLPWGVVPTASPGPRCVCRTSTARAAAWTNAARSKVRLTTLALLAWAAGFRRPPRQTFVVHGEETAALALAERLRAERGWTVTVPEPGQSVRL